MLGGIHVVYILIELFIYSFTFVAVRGKGVGIWVGRCLKGYVFVGVCVKMGTAELAVRQRACFLLLLLVGLSVGRWWMERWNQAGGWFCTGKG